MEDAARDLGDYHFLKLGPDTLENPYDFFARLRREAPVFREPDFGVYLVSRYDDVVEVSTSTDRFSAIVATDGPLTPLPAPVDDLAEYRASNPLSDKLLTNDPPDHTRWRGLYSRLFAPNRVAEFEEEVRARVVPLVEELLAERRFDFVSRFANVLPLLNVSDLLGVPESEVQRFSTIFVSMVENMDTTFVGNPHGKPTSELNATMTSPESILWDYFNAEIAKRMENPEGDILSNLAAVKFKDGTDVPDYEIVKICLTLYGAGGSANAPQMLANGMRILAEHPEIARQIRDDLSLVPNFVEETLRFETSALGLFRVAREDTNLRGVPIHKGETVMMLFASANHDEQYFEDPESFRLDRPAGHVLSFGHGPHTCPGAHVARLEGRIAFEELLRRTSDIRLTEPADASGYLPSFVLRSVRRLPLELVPA